MTASFKCSPSQSRSNLSLLDIFPLCWSEYHSFSYRTPLLFIFLPSTFCLHGIHAGLPHGRSAVLSTVESFPFCKAAASWYFLVGTNTTLSSILFPKYSCSSEKEYYYCLYNSYLYTFRNPSWFSGKTGIFRKSIYKEHTTTPTDVRPSVCVCVQDNFELELNN